MSLQENNDTAEAQGEYDPDHVGIAMTTYNADGSISSSAECCSCKLREPAFIKHMGTIPKGMHVVFLEIKETVQ
jgi:hypothetical protein